MSKTTRKSIQKNKKQTGLNIQWGDKNQTNRLFCDENKSNPLHFNTPQTCNNVDAFASKSKFGNVDLLKDNYYCHQDLMFLEENIADLVNQQKNLIRYHNILTGLDSKSCSNTINPTSLESEILDLKSIVESLKKGLNIVLDDHSSIKVLLTDQIKYLNNLLQRNSLKECRENQYRYSDFSDKYLSIRPKENSSSLLKNMSCDQSLFKMFRTSSVFNSNINSLNTMSQINSLENVDSMAKFRQLSELKIIIEILQKYSKIVTDEFKNVKNDQVLPNRILLDPHLKTNRHSDQKDQLVGCQVETVVSLPKNHFKPSRKIYPQILPFDSEMNIVNREESVKINDNVLIEGSSFKGQDLKNENKWKMKGNVRKPLHGPSQGATSLNKKKVLFLSDGHGQYCSQILPHELGSCFCVISVVKPDAFFEEIVKDFKHLATTFTRDDYVIIFAGSNNLKIKDKGQYNFDFEYVLSIFQHTNVIFNKIPLMFDHPSLNSLVRKANSENSRKVFELAMKRSNILHMPNLTFFSRDHPIHFNKTRNKALCKLLAKTIMNDLFRKKQKLCQEFQCVKNNKTSDLATESILDNTSRSSLNYDSEINISTIITKRHNDILSRPSKSKLDALVSIDHPNFNVRQEETIELFKKSAWTQTSEEDLVECHYYTTNEELLNIDPEICSKERNSTKTLNENTKPYVQSTMVKQHSNIDRPVFTDGFSKYNLEDHNQRQGFFAGIFMKNNHANMSTIKELLGQGDIPKPRKNFIEENVKRLKELKLDKTNKLSSQRSKTLQPLMERRNAQTMVSSSRFSQRQSPPPPLRSRRTTKHVTLDTQPPLVEMDDSPKGYRSQGCQTLNSKQLEHLYDEGVIRYPSVRDLVNEGEERAVREMALQTETPLETLNPQPPPTYTTPPATDEGLHWDEEKKGENKDFVKMNAMVPDPRRHKTPDPSSTDPTRAPASYQRGVVPRYLREHKKEIERERINKTKEDECPEGHIQLPDDIKQKHLTTLRQNYAELVSQLNQLPVSTDTLRTRTRKKQIESDLDRIEAAIALFSREKVFVKADS